MMADFEIPNDMPDTRLSDYEDRRRGDRKALPSNTVKALAERDGGWRCTYCDIEVRPGSAREHWWDSRPRPHPPEHGWAISDHVVPWSQWGSDDLSNLVLACEDCNADKGARTPEQWRNDTHTKFGKERAWYRRLLAREQTGRDREARSESAHKPV